MAIAASPARRTESTVLARYLDFSAIRMLCERDLVRFLRERTQLYGSLARTVLWLFILGAGLRGSVTVPGKVSYLQFVFPGMIAMAIIFASLQSAISIIFDREFGFLKEIMVAPVPRSSIAIGKALAGALIAVAQGAIIFLFAPFAGVHLTLVSVFESLGAMLLIGLGLTGVGIMIAARMTSFEGFGTINNFVVLPLYFTSGAQFPLTKAPHWLRVLARFNPLTYGVDLLRGIQLHVWHDSPVLDLAVTAGFAAVVIAGATVSFGRVD